MAANPPSDPSSVGPPPIPALGEEYGTAKKSLPPLKIVLPVAGVLAVVVAIFAFVQRPQSAATGSIDDLVAADITGQNSVMVAVNVSIHNRDKTAFKMREVKVDLDTGGEVHSDEPASAVDFERYLQALPTLKAHVLSPLKVETIEPGGERQGTILVVFPVTSDAVAHRKALTVTISAYGEVQPLVLTK